MLKIICEQSRSFRCAAIAAALLLLSFSAVWAVPDGAAEDSSPGAQAAFHPTWKLLTPQQKSTFISGYLKAEEDARTVLQITHDYLETSPQDAQKTLEALLRVYRPSSASPTILAERIDKFYADPDNRQAPLSKALSAAKQLP